MELLELYTMLDNLLKSGVPKNTPVKFEASCDCDEDNQWIEGITLHEQGSSGYELEGSIDLY